MLGGNFIDTWDVRTFDPELMTFLQRKTDLIRGYYSRDREIFLKFDTCSGRDKPLFRPANVYTSEFYKFREFVGRLMADRVIRGFHYTRLTDGEVNDLRRSGIRIVTREILRAKLDDLVMSGALNSTDADRLFRESHLQSDPTTDPPPEFWLTSRPKPLDHSGIARFLSTWGGEVIHRWIEDPNRLGPIERIGLPRIIEVAVPLSITDRSNWAGDAVVATFGRSFGCITDRHDFDICAHQGLPPDAILALHTEGEDCFRRMALGYPNGYVDFESGGERLASGDGIRGC